MTKVNLLSNSWFLDHLKDCGNSKIWKSDLWVKEEKEKGKKENELDSAGADNLVWESPLHLIVWPAVPTFIILLIIFIFATVKE